MLEHYIQNRKRLVAMKRNYLAPYLEKIAERYCADGYHFKHARRRLGFAFRFVEWLEAAHVLPGQITAKHVDKFLQWYVPKPPEKFQRKRKLAYSAAHSVLRQIWAEHPPVITRSPSRVEADRYADHLRRNRGLAEGTVEGHRRNLEQFLTFSFRQRPVEPSAITARRVHAYVDALPHGRANCRRRQTCTALRGYFRFLRMLGVEIGNLLVAVPTVRVPRAALSPRWLTSADTEQLLRSIDRSTASGKRDYAAILCMIHLGVRVGDVPRLSLDDIDWREGTVQVANHKTGRPYQMPLPRRLGKALADYLVKGRLPSQRREIFLCHTHPRGTPVTVKALQGVMRYAWQRAGLGEKFSGTHILRHSIATRMRQKGVGLKSIADVLGHQSMQTTTLYAQVDLPALRAVAQPWLEVRP
jgi:site-specific recombinase XerD